MADYNDSDNKNGQNDIYKMVNDIAKSFDGKNQTELIKAVFLQAKERKQKGMLSNEEIDNFKNMLYPLLDDQKKKILNKIVIDLKKL